MILRVTGERGSRAVSRSAPRLHFPSRLLKPAPRCKITRRPAQPEIIRERTLAATALSAKAVFKPTKEFHTARHTLYSAEENMEIDKVVPVAASVKTKLGKGGSAED